MYATYFKRTLTALIASLILFSVCFVCHVSVLATEETETPAPSITEPSVPDDQNGQGGEDTGSSEPDNQNSTTEGDSSQGDGNTSQDTDSQAPSDPSSEESSQPESSEDVVSQISDGGAPDFYDDQYYNDGSYEYHGSYTGLSSSVSQETQQEEQPQKPVDNRSPLAKKYAKVLYVGMALFGGLSILLVGALVYFNLKVKQSKATYPDWYKRREAARRGKHAK